MRKLLYMVAVSVVATLAFSSVAQAQYLTNSNGECSNLEEEFSEEEGFEETLAFVPDAGGCIDAGGSGAYGPVANTLNKVALDPDTGEQIGVVKDLDPDISSGGNSVTHQEFCEDFEVSPVTQQEYFDSETQPYGAIEGANAQEREILDPDGDGQACTDEDLSVATGGGASGDDTAGGDVAQGGGASYGEQYGDTPTGDQYGSPEDESDDNGGQQADEVPVLPDTGGLNTLLVVAGVLVGSGVLGLLLSMRRRA